MKKENIYFVASIANGLYVTQTFKRNGGCYTRELHNYIKETYLHKIFSESSLSGIVDDIKSKWVKTKDFSGAFYTRKRVTDARVYIMVDDVALMTLRLVRGWDLRVCDIIEKPKRIPSPVLTKIVEGMTEERLDRARKEMSENIGQLDELPTSAKHSEDLEQEVESYFSGHWPGTKTSEQCNTVLTFTPPAILRLVQHFTQWQKNQMMKEAMEGEVYKFGEIAYVKENNTALTKYLSKFNNGDKVKIIIVKEEEK